MPMNGVPLPSLAFPEDRLREVLQVLLRNAAEAMGNSGSVVVQSECVEGAVRILVRDQGPGIPGEILARMMKPGYTTKPCGSGFGLFLARRVVEAYGGSLKIVPSSGAGAELCLTLRPA
jgi:signal transduction histidine kinase